MALFSCHNPGSCFYWLLFCAAMFAVRKCRKWIYGTLKWGVVRKLRIWAMTVRFAFFLLWKFDEIEHFDLTFLTLRMTHFLWPKLLQPKLKLTKAIDKTKREKSLWKWLSQYSQISFVNRLSPASAFNSTYSLYFRRQRTMLVSSWKGRVNIWKSVILVSLHYFPLWRVPIRR